jgi:hypothetical protein
LRYATLRNASWSGRAIVAGISVSLTPAGKTTLGRLRAISKQVEKDFLAPLDPEQRRTLHTLLLELAAYRVPRTAYRVPRTAYRVPRTAYRDPRCAEAPKA